MKIRAPNLTIVIKFHEDTVLLHGTPIIRDSLCVKIEKWIIQMSVLDPCEHRKKSSAKAPEPIYRDFFNADYRKPKVVGVSIFFA